MCIVAVAWQLFDDMPLLLLSNRDEFLDRPTLPIHQWQDLPIYAGRDKKSGGTWLGYATKSKNNNRWATVLNYRDMISATPEQLSRGQLVTDFLTSDLSPMAFAKQINLKDYAGFNLIVGDSVQAVLVNNRGYPPTALHAGLYLISNGQPDDVWFKNERLRTRMSQEVLPLIAQGVSTSEWQKVAFEVLADTQLASDEQLPNTGVPYKVEKALSSVFIAHNRLQNYGTRTQSILKYEQESGFELLTQ